MDRKELADVLIKSAEDACNAGKEGYKPHFRLEKEAAKTYLIELRNYYEPGKSEIARSSIARDVHEYLLQVTDITMGKEIPPFLEGAAAVNLPLVSGAGYTFMAGIFSWQAIQGGAIETIAGALFSLACAAYCFSCIKKYRKVKDAVKKQKTNSLHDIIEKEGADLLPEILDASRAKVLPYLGL